MEVSESEANDRDAESCGHPGGRREHGGTYELRCDTSVVRSRYMSASKNMNSTNGRTFTGEGEGVRKGSMGPNESLGELLRP